MFKLWKDNDASIDMILTAIIAAIVFAISIAIVYAVLGGIDYTTYDAGIGVTNTTPAANASESLLGNLSTFYNLGPIYIVVIAAVGIIAAVLMVRRG
jgi:succinate dehydrogenase/fumarate reductase cytochrome b subunit